MQNEGVKVEPEEWHKQCNAATKYKSMPLKMYK